MMNKILSLTKEEVDGLEDLGLSYILVEISNTGETLREIGFDKDDIPVYRHPGHSRFGNFGLLDNQIIHVSDRDGSILISYFDSIFNSIE